MQSEAGTTINYNLLDRSLMGMGDAITLFLQAKRNSNYRESYITSLRRYLSQFSRGREHIGLHEITPELIEEWFASRNESASARASNLGRLSAFFEWCRRRRYIPENPCDFIERVRVDRAPPKILTVDQLKTLLDHCRTKRQRLLLWFVLSAFVGIRRDELQRLSRTEIEKNVEQRIIIIDSAASKVRRRRIVELTDWQTLWVQSALACERADLPIPKTTIIRAIKRFRKLLGFEEWPQDVLRHTALSHMIAETKDAGKVALWAGNSPKILLSHYNGLVLPKEHEELLKIKP